jgi:GDP-L-fucose synthase
MEGPWNEAINVASGSMTIRELVETLSKITGVNEIHWDSSQPNGQEYRKADLSRLKIMGFAPAYSIEDGLRQTWNWYRNEQTHQG